MQDILYQGVWKTSPEFSAVIVVEERETLSGYPAGYPVRPRRRSLSRGGSPPAPRYPASVLERRSPYFQGSLL
jgi:hypothetical protein